MVYDPQASNPIQDQYHPGLKRSLYDGYSLNEYKQRTGHDGAVAIPIEDVVEREEKRWTTEGCEVTKKDFWDMLEVLPPLRQEWGAGWMFFAMSEFASGNVTAFFVRFSGVPERYVTFQANAYLAKDEVIEKARRVLTRA